MGMQVIASTFFRRKSHLEKNAVGRRTVLDNKPIMNPPKWLKLSTPGSKPINSEMRVENIKLINILPGFTVAFQLWIKSTKIVPINPNRAPLAPTDGMAKYAKFAPKMNPNVPLSR